MSKPDVSPDNKFTCRLCMFTTDRKQDYVRHMATLKHRDNCKTQTEGSYVYCECGKTYRHKSGLSRHKPVCPVHLQLMLDTGDDDGVKSDDGDTQGNRGQSCSPPQEEPIVGSEIKGILTDIAHQLRELKETQSLQQQQITANVNNNYILNLNMFLNENCKDALSVQDFIKQITFVFDDLKDKAWRSRVLLNNLGSLQLENRPFHCLDTTTCQVVLKNGGQWQEGNKDDIVSTLDSCGKQVQTQFGPQWDLQYPGWADSDSHSRKYVDLWRNITKEQSPSQVEEDLKRVSQRTTIPSDKSVPTQMRRIK